MAWFADRAGPSLLIVPYDEIWDRKAEIGAFFGIDDPAFVVDFPARRLRTRDQKIRGASEGPDGSGPHPPAVA